MELNKIINGDCLEELKKLPDNSIDSIVTDPPAGSGSTLIAAKKLGHPFIGIEKEADYIKIIEARIKAIPQILI